MGCACSNRGKVKPINSAFLKGQAEATTFDYENPTHSRTLNNIEVITPRLRFAKTFADRINRKLLDGSCQLESEASTGTDSRYMLAENFLPFQPEEVVLNMNRVKHVRDMSQPGETDSLCSGALTNAARNFYVRDSVSEFSFRRGEDAQRFTFNPNSRQTTTTNLREELKRARKEAGIHESSFSINSNRHLSIPIGTLNLPPPPTTVSILPLPPATADNSQQEDYFAVSEDTNRYSSRFGS